MAKDSNQGGYGIIGLGRFGATLAKELADAGEDVLVVDNSEDKIRQAREYTDAAFVSRRLDKETLMDCGIQNCDTVIVAIGEKLDTSILTTLNVIQLGVRRVIAKAISADQGAVLTKLGAEVVYPESDMAIRLARRLTTKSVLDSLILDENIEISELAVSAPLSGQTIAQANLRAKYGINILALVRPAGITTELLPSSMLADGDAIVVIGRKENIARLEQQLSRH